MPEALKITDRNGDIMTIQMGPQHPSTHGVLHLEVDLDGETIVDLRPNTGFLHRGTEKMMETRPYQKSLPLTDRYDYLSPLSNNWAFSMAVERIAGIEVTERAEYIRVIFAELSRLASHLVWLATHALDIGAMTVFLYCFREREIILDMFEEATGQRMTSSWICIGGVRKDITPKFVQQLEEFLAIIDSRIDIYERLLDKNRIWTIRTQEIGLLSYEMALSSGMSGPIMRGSGVDFDLRRDEPYGVYSKFEFEVPTEKEGDTYARYRVRMREMRESAKILRQAVKAIPKGRVLAGPTPEGTTEDKYAELDEKALMGWIASRGVKPPKGTTYAAVEAPKGELGFYIISEGEDRPYRIKVRSPSFVNTNGIPLLSKGHMIADLIAVIGTVDIVLGEVDR